MINATVSFLHNKAALNLSLHIVRRRSEETSDILRPLPFFSRRVGILVSCAPPHRFGRDVGRSLQRIL
jgi:hypothetical protein